MSGAFWKILLKQQLPAFDEHAAHILLSIMKKHSNIYFFFKVLTYIWNYLFMLIY